jgi:bifunctional non-homologous end joining protein LigD
LVSGHKVELSNLDKVFWPEEGYTKGDLIQYYLEVGAYLMPYLKQRPAILQRFPNGLLDAGFYQQHIEKAPPFVKTIRLENQVGRFLEYAIYANRASLIYLVNLGTITQNPWHSRVANLDHPDYIVFDLDPHSAPFANVLEVALGLKAVLDERGVRGYPKTSGSSGVHIYVPIRPGYEYDQVKVFAEETSRLVVTRLPKIATLERRIAARDRNQVYVDWQQNARGKSAASVYSVRARPGAPVSTPVTWNEISSGVQISDFTMRTVPARLAQVGDLWEGMLKDRQTLPCPATAP